MHRNFYLIILAFFSFIINLEAQTAYSLKIVFNNDSTIFLKQLPYQTTFSDINERNSELQNFINKLYNAGYLAASFDSIVNDTASLKIYAFLDLGKVYEWVYLKKGNIDEGILNETGFRDKIFNRKAFHYKNVAQLIEKLITYYENNGYPFAAVKLDSIIIDENMIKAGLYVSKNIEIRIDTIINHNKANITNPYLYSYLGLKPGDLYNESAIKKISERINELPFLKETKPFNISFQTNNLNTKGKAQINLFLENKKANQFDGIVGILPDNNREGKINFTGDIHFRLYNTFGKGILLDVNWRGFQPQTQDLKTKLLYPFIFSTPFGLDLNFSIFKKDTTYIDVIQNLGVQYILKGGNFFKVFVENKTSSLLLTSNLENLTALPPYADISSTIYGVGLKNEKLDYRLNPRKGFAIETSTAAGSKEIKKNPKINSTLYDSLELKTIQYSFGGKIQWFYPIKNRSVINLAVNSGYMYNKEIFQNELFRIGGIKTLRGFDEESILASAYSIFTLEYRYLLEQNSYLFIFTDGCYYENKSRNNNYSDMPYGFGAGISFETRAGIFSINYALGSQKNNPVDLRSGKVHFGIVNYF